MNRIYQGRVKAIELLKDKVKKGEDPVVREYSKAEGEQVLWDFHEIFQDAVNYYLVCLMALASDPDNPITKIRERVDGDDPEFNVWKPFRRKGQQRQGMREIAKYFGLNSADASLEDCCAAALEGNSTPKEVLDLALQELLEDSASGDVRNTGKEMFPRFCSPKYKHSYPSDKKLKKRAQNDVAEWLHNPVLSNQEVLARLRFDFFANINVAQPSKKGADAKAILIEGVGFLKEQQLIVANLADSLSREIEQLDDNVEFPAYTGGSVNKVPLKRKFYLYLLLQHVGVHPELLELLKNSYPAPKKKKESTTDEVDFLKYGDDPIRLARQNGKQRGFIFRAFTVLAEFGEAKDNEPSWRNFDITAFIEALKAFHQIEQKGAERRKEKKQKQKVLEYMLTGNGNLQKLQADDESFEIPPVLKDDPRIQQLEKVVKSLAFESDLKEGEVSEYGLRERSIRGYEKLAKEWNRLKLGGLSDSDAKALLKEKLTELQVDQKEKIGSVALFEKLMEREHWIVWQTPDKPWPEKWADNPLAAYVQKLVLDEKIRHLSGSIRFTPADAQYSRRQYQLGDKNTFKNLNGTYHHEQNVLAVVTSVAVKEKGCWSKQRVRIHYSAPRFLRDGLRGGEESLVRMPWMQPMMEALGENLEFPQDLHNFPVFLMPKKGRRDENIIHLNFPITLDESAVVAAVGSRERWLGQFAGGGDAKIYLRWPADEWPKGWKEKAWYKSFKPFRLVSVDLGVRDAGALALIECRPDQEFYTSKGGKRHCRCIGEANGRKWYAAVIKTKMLRLPGEDALVWRDGKLQQELSGEKGRLAKKHETDEAREIAASLGYADFVGDDVRFFANQNQKLLVTLRWAQGRLRGWQSLSWKLGIDAEKEDAQKALQEQEKLSTALKHLVEGAKWTLVPEQLERDISELKELLSVSLERIANRVVPLRRRNWEWSLRDNGGGYILRQTERGSDKSKTWIAGQRGLSIERIELIEELRRRCQSLNKALQHEAGTKPKLGFGTKGAEAPDPCPDILEKLDHIREQRVNQTAHLILAEALGVQLKPHSKPTCEREQKDIHGEYEKVREPVDFIVLENLNRYLTSQGRSRSENSRLMKWCHRAILGKLKQLCETYGIAVLETAAAYSSRFSAKDGSPGFRAKEVTVLDRDKFPWKKMLENNDPEVVQLFRQLDEISAGQNSKKPRKLLAPIAGGPIFIPMVGSETQADINAAINLGLRAVAAPDMLEIHHKIRTEPDGSGSLKPLTRSKREKARWDKAPGSFEFAESVKLERNSNCFPLVGFRADFENCLLDGRHFATGNGLWKTIRNQQWKRVADLNAARIRRNGWEDDIPM